MNRPSYDIKLENIKALSRIKPTNPEAKEDQFIIHVKGCIDHVVFFTNELHFEQTYQAIKYVYWKN